MAGEATTSGNSDTDSSQGDAPEAAANHGGAGGAAPSSDTGQDAGGTAADGPDWQQIEADLEAEVAGNAAANTEPGAAATGCSTTSAAALGVLVATSDTHEFVGNATVELTQSTEEPASGNAGGSGADGTNGGARQRPPADHSKPTGAESGTAIWTPIEPAGEYFINVPVLPDDYREEYSPPPDDQYTVTVSGDGPATCIVFIHPKPWIEIELLNGLGEPAEGHPYRLELPPADDGGEPVVLKEGKLDDEGFARITQDDVAPGTNLADCHVIFPGSAPPEPLDAALGVPDWISIELRDTLGMPAKRWRYELFKPGDPPEAPSYTGTLDDVGSAIVSGDAGLDQCNVAFLPPLPRADFMPENLHVPWTTLEVLDGRGEPAAGWRYEILAEGGDVRYRGTLDGSGRATVAGVAEGEFEVIFSPPLV